MLRFLFYTVAVLILVPSATAQSPGPASSEHDRGWVTIGFSSGFPRDLSPGATVNLGRKRAIQLGYHVAYGLSANESASYTNVRTVDVGFGRSWVNRWSRLAGFVGPAVTWGDGISGFTTAGAFANAQVIFTPVSEIGIGATLWGSLNPERSVGGFGVMLVFEGNK